MNLLKIGNQIINLNKITRILIPENAATNPVRVFLGVFNPNTQDEISLELWDEQATAFLSYLKWSHKDGYTEIEV